MVALRCCSLRSVVALLLWLGFIGTGILLRGQGLQTLDYVTLTAGRVYVVTNNLPVLLKAELTLNPEVKVMTNGVIQVSGLGQARLTEGRRLTFDAFWWNSDGLMVPLQPHYMMKDRALYFVKDGLLQPLSQDVAFPNGTQLRLDGTLLTRAQQFVRIQDGQMLSPDGQPLQAFDHVMVTGGRLVLQKDGSILNLPAGRVIGMSDSTRIDGSGVVTRLNGEQIVLREGQRLTLPGPAMATLR